MAFPKEIEQSNLLETPSTVDLTDTSTFCAVSNLPSGSFQIVLPEASVAEDMLEASSSHNFNSSYNCTQSQDNAVAYLQQSQSCNHYFGYTLGYTELYSNADMYPNTAHSQFCSLPQNNYFTPNFYSNSHISSNSLKPSTTLTDSVQNEFSEMIQYSSSENSLQSASPQSVESNEINDCLTSEKKPNKSQLHQPIPTFFLQQQQQRSPFETFCTVPGRTSLLSSTTKYKVTIAEIQRRISPPECLNASLLGGILRKAKSKDGGKALRESLKRIGLSLPAGRRKSANVTSWTALVEEEAVHMAKDFHSVCERDFPAKEIAIFLARNLNGEEDVQRRRTMLHNVRQFIKEISELMNSDRSPICGNRPEVILDPSIQKPLTHFSMVSHGFGGLAIVAVLDALNVFVHESFRHMDKSFGVGMLTNNPLPYCRSQRFE